MSLGLLFLQNAKALFGYYQNLGEKAMAQLPAEALFVQYGNDANTIAVIVQHLSGNMLSRWTDFLTTDGEKPWRTRDAEFETVLTTQEEVMQAWEKGWACLYAALAELQPEQLTQTVTIRQQPQSVMEALQRQVAHYAYHVGQIVYLAKSYKGEAWASLSIPRNQSAQHQIGTFLK